MAEDVATRTPYFLVELRILADQLRRLPKVVRIYPGMPVFTAIVTGSRSVLDYVLQPLKDSFGGALHEQ